MRLLKAIFFLACICAGTAYADYPYANKCPSGGQVFGSDYYSSYLGSWVSIYNFAQCNCTDYVAYWLNSMLEQHSATSPMFTNKYYGYSWGDAYQWRNSINHGVPGYSARYPIEAFSRDGTDQWKIDANGAPYNTTVVVAYWDATSSNKYGHVARVKNAQSDNTVTVGEYNWPTTENGKKWNVYGERTLRPGESGYPNGFLYLATDSFF